MPHPEIVEACRLAYSGFGNNERSKLLSLLDPAIVFEFPSSLPYGGTYEGIEAFKAFWQRVCEYYDRLLYDIRAIIDGEEHIVVQVVARAVTKTGRSMENEQCFIFKVRNGRIVHGRVYTDTAKARDIVLATLQDLLKSCRSPLPGPSAADG